MASKTQEEMAYDVAVADDNRVADATKACAATGCTGCAPRTREYCRKTARETVRQMMDDFDRAQAGA